MALGSNGPQLDEITASDVASTATGNVVATDVQSAIAELDTEKAKLSGGNTFTGDQIIDTGNIGIGTATPQEKIHVFSRTAADQSVLIDGQGTSPSYAPTLDLRFSGDSGGVFTPVSSTSTLGQIAFRGNVATGTPSYSTAALITSRADGTITGSAVPGRIEIRTADSAGANQLNFAIRSNGALEATQAVNYTTLVTQSYHLANKGYVDSLAGSIKYKTGADVANSSNVTLTNITALQHSVTSGTTYVFEYYLLYTSAATTTGIVLSMGATTAVGTVSANVQILFAADGSAGEFNGAITSFGDVVISTATVALATVYVAKISGVFVCTTSGTLYPQFRSEINGSAITLKAGSAAVLVSI